MTNNQVGTVYQQIIQDVIESSRVDFEEGGVDEHVLEELKQVRYLRFLLCLSISRARNIIEHALLAFLFDIAWVFLSRICTSFCC